MKIVYAIDLLPHFGYEVLIPPHLIWGDLTDDGCLPLNIYFNMNRSPNSSRRLILYLAMKVWSGAQEKGNRWEIWVTEFVQHFVHHILLGLYLKHQQLHKVWAFIFIDGKWVGLIVIQLFYLNEVINDLIILVLLDWSRRSCYWTLSRWITRHHKLDKCKTPLHLSNCLVRMSSIGDGLLTHV